MTTGRSGTFDAAVYLIAGLLLMGLSLWAGAPLAAVVVLVGFLFLAFRAAWR